MNKSALIGVVVVLLLISGLYLMDKPAHDPNEFLLNAITIPATPVDIPVADVGNTIDVEIGVNDTIDEPDDTPWTLCGTIAGDPLNSFENTGFSYDVLGYLDPLEQPVIIRQDVTDDSVFFPQGGSTEDIHTFKCVDHGKDEMYFYYMTSRLVRDCSPESLLVMQDDPDTIKKTLPLGEVTCVDPTQPPKEIGLERSTGTPVTPPQGFEYIGGQTIEIGADGEFIDRGYLDRGNPPQ